MQCTQMSGSQSIDGYIAAQPSAVRDKLTTLRDTIRAAAPGARERIVYGIPTFTLGENLVHFAAYKQHVGLYPGPAAIEAFDRELRPYDCATGSVRFPLNHRLPLDLIARIVSFRATEADARAASKR